MRDEHDAHRPGDGTVRVGGTLGLPAVVAELGADPTEVLGELNVDVGLFSHPDNLMSYRLRGRLLSHCAARTGCPHFGLLVGARGGLESLGLVGLLARHSRDVASALRCIVRYLHLHVRGATVSLRDEDEQAVFSYEIYEPHVAGADQIGDGAVAMMLSVMRALCGPGWAPSEVRVSHRQPDDVGPYRRLFRAPVRFDCAEDALVFPREWLDHRLAAAESEIRRLLQRQIDALEDRYDGAFPEQVRSVLRVGLLTGHGRAPLVAALFSMHSRTLARRLEAHGTTFRTLLDECRYTVARQMLENTKLDVTEIAAALDYADASAFTRAFRRWSGTTPAHWRAERRAAH